jgi:hypothetical protein
MIILGIILLLIGFLLNIPILWTIGVVLLVIGLILFVLGSTGRAVGGRRHWYCSTLNGTGSEPGNLIDLSWDIRQIEDRPHTLWECRTCLRLVLPTSP